MGSLVSSQTAVLVQRRTDNKRTSGSELVLSKSEQKQWMWREGRDLNILSIGGGGGGGVEAKCSLSEPLLPDRIERSQLGRTSD